MRRTIVALAALALALAAVSGIDRPGALAGPNCTIDAGIDSQEQQFLQLINDYRADNGRAPLKLSDRLNRAAAWKSWHMATENYFAHDDVPINRSWVDRFRDCGYTYNAWLGENIAAGNSSAQATFDQWRNSPGHNANMLSENYTAIGVGRAQGSGSTYGWYWTTTFGSFSDGYTTPAPSATPTPTPSPAPPPGSDPDPCHDLTGDGRVRVMDVIYVVERFNSGDTSADVNGDGLVSVADVAAVVHQFGRDC